MTQGLTKRQSALLAFLKASPSTPSFEEMREALGLASKSRIYRLLDALEDRGFIERIPNRARAIRVLDTPRSWDGPSDLTQFTEDELLNELRRRAERRPA